MFIAVDIKRWVSASYELPPVASNGDENISVNAREAHRFHTLTPAAGEKVFSWCSGPLSPRPQAPLLRRSQVVPTVKLALCPKFFLEIRLLIYVPDRKMGPDLTGTLGSHVGTHLRLTHGPARKERCARPAPE